MGRELGEPVGNGWQGMQQVFGGVSEVEGFGHVVMAVDLNGDLSWYRYTGSGKSDISGALGWEARLCPLLGGGRFRISVNWRLRWMGLSGERSGR